MMPQRTAVQPQMMPRCTTFHGKGRHGGMASEASSSTLHADDLTSVAHASHAYQTAADGLEGLQPDSTSGQVEELPDERVARRLCFTFVIAIRPSRAADFNLVPKLIGKNGANARRIEFACGGKVRVRGRGVGRREGRFMREAPCNLRISLSCPSEASLMLGCNMLTAFLNDIAQEYRLFCQANNIHTPARFYTIVEHGT
eukprot:gnl/TRDRNA2_/TRDRNA2_132635_c0_seq1.p1 gnl/TRDRNA2_/TRDRNA2_132635_c0~~gnl/TRDRNA2_/TRDRNA2_132635_c0_seq1.p1  ORF type:complete len:200 (-),score=11.96 gnl/TRDRNA2_/TRDRNA2_132635_c0_seq1:201-800(-)